MSKEKIKSGGYIYIKQSDGTRIAEHHLVWKLANGSIPEGYCIHHKNGNKQDNRLENLELMTHGGHSSLHRRSKDYPEFTIRQEIFDGKCRNPVCRISLDPKGAKKKIFCSDRCRKDMWVVRETLIKLLKMYGG